MPSFTRGYTFSSVEQVTNDKLHLLVDNATQTQIVNADVSTVAAIADTKLASITTASKVNGAAITGLANIPSGAGEIPAVNLAAIYPIGCIYTTTVPTDPATVFGFGTWEAFGEGKVLVGLDSADSDFDTVEMTGGDKTVTSDAQGGHTHEANPGTTGVVFGAGGGEATAGEHTHTVSTVQPYVVVYFFKRTA
jgi:hypothetical protein